MISIDASLMIWKNIFGVKEHPVCTSSEKFLSDFVTCQWSMGKEHPVCTSSNMSMINEQSLQVENYKLVKLCSIPAA